MEKLYKIGTIAQVLGMPVHVVRFYEEKGLLTSKHLDGSTTRYFDEYDINRLVYTKLYRSMDFSIEEIQELFEREARYEEIDYYELLAEKQRKILEKIRHLERIQKQLCRYKDDFYEFCRYGARITTVRLPEFYWSFTMDQVRSMEEFPRYRPAADVVTNRIFPEIRLMAVGDAAAMAEKTGQYPYDWGLAFGEEHLHLFTEEQRHLLKKIPAKEYYTSYIIPDRDCILTREMAEPLRRQAEADGIKPTGCFLAELLPGGVLKMFLPKN